MKKLFKYYLPLTICFLALGVFFLVYIVQGHLAVLKYCVGELGLEGKGKIISKQINAEVKEDGVEKSNIKLLKDEEKIYVISQRTEHPGFGVLIIDKEKKDIFVPLVSGECYGLIISKYLFQSECGQRGDYYSGEKKGNYNVNFDSDASQIKFQIPKEYNDGKVISSRQIEITFKD